MKIAYALIFCLLSVSSFASDMPEKIDAEYAGKLMEMAHIKYDSYSEPDPDLSEGAFIVFQVLGEYTGTAGWYSVNQWTGDVWDAWNCKEIISPALQREQEKIKKTYNHSELKEYERLHKLRPYNPGTLDPC